ncbi:unnamed protein product [Protopolystoma xenopodis]|uniref:Uncharacterized protein n=1 Tax=Protopolystoma xenopodis TaxID=117903 RepID=A0A3S5B1J2_9PLAT|nr:unnamed protein product [Protopolystoma xenopodis]
MGSLACQQATTSSAANLANYTLISTGTPSGQSHLVQAALLTTATPGASATPHPIASVKDGSIVASAARTGAQSAARVILVDPTSGQVNTLQYRKLFTHLRAHYFFAEDNNSWIPSYS